MRPEIEVLEHHAELGADAVDLAPVGRLRGSVRLAPHLDHLAGDRHLARVGRLEQVDAAQKRALAGAGRAEDRDDVAILGGERDALEHLQRTKSLVHVLDGQGRGRCGGHVMGSPVSSDARAQMRRQAPLEAQESGAEDVIDGEINGAGQDQRQVGDQRVVADLERHAQHVPERDQRDERGRLDHRDHLGRVGGQRVPERDRKDDAPEEQEPRHAAGARGFDRAVRHGDERPAKNLGLIACGAKPERQHAATERVAQDRPDDAVAHGRERSEAVVDDEELDEQRGAAEDRDVGAREDLERLRAADPHPGDARGHEASEDDRQEPDFERQRQGAHQPPEGGSP